MISKEIYKKNGQLLDLYLLYLRHSACLTSNDIWYTIIPVWEPAGWPNIHLPVSASSSRWKPQHVHLYDQNLRTRPLIWPEIECPKRPELVLALNFWRSRYPWNLEVCLNFAVIIFSIYKKKNSKLIRKPIQFKSTADTRNVLHSKRKLNQPITSITSRIHASSPIWSG